MTSLEVTSQASAWQDWTREALVAEDRLTAARKEVDRVAAGLRVATDRLQALALAGLEQSEGRPVARSVPVTGGALVVRYLADGKYYPYSVEFIPTA